MQHFNAFNQSLCDLLALEMKLEEEDKALLLLSSLSQNYNHLATTIIFRKDILELEDVRQMFQNNDLMKKTYFIEETSRLVVKEQGKSQSRGPKKGTKASSENNDCYYFKQPGHMKNCFKYEDAKEVGWSRR